MADLGCEYLGLRLANPLVPSASPLSKSLTTALQLQDAGAAALVMHSLFEEKIQHQAEHLERFFHQQAIGHGEAESFHPVPDDYQSYQDDHLEQVQRLKGALDIPLIASLNGVSVGGWVEYARDLEQAGADALELNTWFLPTRPEQSSSEVEAHYIEVLRAVVAKVSIPVAVKLPEQLSAPLHLAKQLQDQGVAGIALFNRFYQPDIELDTLAVAPRVTYSSPVEALLRVRWTAIFDGHLSCSLAVTGGFHRTDDVIKALLAGADVVHLCAALLTEGHDLLGRILDQLQAWLEAREYASIDQLRGSVNARHAIDPAAYERTSYIEVLDSYSRPPGVLA